MKISRYIIGVIFLTAFMFNFSFAQETGDYQSAASGNWSDAATWEVFTDIWEPAIDPPDGSGRIMVSDTDTVWVDVAVTISDTVTVSGSAVIDTTSGTLTFADGGVYNHARDEGEIPSAIWETGSTYMLTGITGKTPGNRNQNFYNIVLNTPDMISNRDLGLDDVIIGGDIHVISSGSARWRLTSASGGDTAIVTIMGDLLVEGGSQFETQGTSNALTTFVVNHYGNLTVTDANFSIARGSQGSGSGKTTWNLYNGDFTFSNGETKNSNPTPGNAKLVFASPDSQQVSFTDVNYGGGQIHFKVSDSTKLKIVGEFMANGLFVNEGEIEPLDPLTFLLGSTYEHARDGGDVPTATWDVGSTALFTGITGSAPGNRGQDYFNLTLNTPGLLSNRDMDLDGHTIAGNLTLLSSGSARWRLVGGSSGTVTIMGDVIVEDGSLETLGTSSATEVEVLHHGNVIVTGGTFAVSRGSQGGIGTTKWYLLEGDFSISDATTRNSNPAGATFIFAKENGVQNIILNNVDYGGGGLPIQVDSMATLNMDTMVVAGNGNFVLKAGATLATANSGGLDSTIQSTGDTTFSKSANFTFNGTEVQKTGNLLPDTLGTLTITNPAGVLLDDTSFCTVLVVSDQAMMMIDDLGSITADSGFVNGTIVNRGDLEALQFLIFENGSLYEHARDGGDIPTGVWNEGSTMLMTGTISSTPGNRNQSYYNLTLNTPDLSSNKDMALDDVTIGGDIHVISSGSARWRLTSASGGDTAIVNIIGDVIVEGGSFETQGTSNALTVFEVHHYGDVNVTGGIFAVSRGSQGNGSGSTRWFMHEGDFSINNAQTRNSNPDNAWFVFDKDTLQTITLTDASYGGGGLPIKVADGAMLDFGVSQLGGSGLFELEAGAKLITANEGGIDSTLQNSGDLTLSDSASFTFNGNVTQTTGLTMPTTVDNLTIDNAAGVKLSQETTINGILWLVLGVFDNTISFTLGPDGEIVYGEGSLLIVDDIESELSVLPKKFALYQNFPNPFNPSTTISYDLPKQAPVTITIFDVMGRQVAKLVDGEHSAGAYSVSWDATDYASGLYYYQIEAGNFVSVRKLVLMK